MKKRNRHNRWCIVWAFPVLMGFSTGQARAADALKIAYPEFYPFFDLGPDNQPRGFFFEIIETPVNVSAMKFHLMISKESKFTRILPEFDRTIHKMREEGTIQRIVSAYY